MLGLSELNRQALEVKEGLPLNEIHTRLAGLEALQDAVIRDVQAQHSLIRPKGA
jgi:hypothetical protein